MLVKCVDTGEKKEKSECYVVQKEVQHKDGNITMKSVFYSSEEAYLKIQENAKLCRDCSDFMFFTILGYESGHDMNTNFYKRLQKWNKTYGYKVILETMQQVYQRCNNYISSKEFDSETQRINYWSSTIENNLQDVYMQLKRIEKHKNIIVDEPALIDIDIKNHTAKNNKVDISKFLED